MNTIAAISRKNDFCDGPHLDIAIDGRCLSDVLADVQDVLSAADCRGLIPCLLPWHEGPKGEEEMRISLERFLPKAGATTRAPVLMCPDDCDFWCTVVIAEVEHDEHVVRWSRIGLDRSESSTLPDGIGSVVQWASSFAGWEFDPVQYRAVFEAFFSLSRPEAEPGASPNGGPATQLGHPGVTEGPPSVS